MKINPITLQDNKKGFLRKVQVNYINIDLLAQSIDFGYTLFHFSQKEGEEKEITRLRETSILVANNINKVDKTGNVTEKGDLGEYDFWLAYITGQSFEIEKILSLIIEAQEKKGKFDIL
jgi:hypothetical protein